MPEYILPDPPYDPGALEPYYSREIIELHHGKHHAAYVAGANTTLEKLADARAKGDFGAIVGLEKALSFNISDHVLSTTFAASMRSTTPVPSSRRCDRGRGGGLVGRVIGLPAKVSGGGQSSGVGALPATFHPGLRSRSMSSGGTIPITSMPPRMRRA